MYFSVVSAVLYGDDDVHIGITDELLTRLHLLLLVVMTTVMLKNSCSSYLLIISTHIRRA